MIRLLGQNAGLLSDAFSSMIDGRRLLASTP
jgi:hypothetical protein